MDGRTLIRQRNVINGVWRPDSAITEEQKMDRSQAGIILPGHSGVLNGAMNSESRFKDYDSYIRAVKEIPWVFAAVSLIAYSFATAPGDWYDGDEPITDVNDPLLKLWARPNPRQSGMVFRELMAMYIELAGEAYISLEEMDAGGEPGELYLPNPARMRIVQDRLGDVIGYVYDTSGFHYDGRIPPPFIPYGVDEIIHIKTANPMNEMRGLGNIEAMETTMNIMAAMTGNELSYWQSGGRITGVLETDQQVDDNTFDQLVQRWRQFTADKRQRFKTAILEQGLKYTPVAEGFKGLDYSKLDTAKRDFVLANFGIPKNKLGIIEDAQYKSDEADRFFWSETMEPRMVRFEDHIQPLGDIFGVDRSYRFERRNFEDDTVKLNNAMVMRSLKAFTTNEIRVYISVPEIDGPAGDTVILQQTDVVVPIDKLADADTTAGAAGGGPPSTTPPDKMKPAGGPGGHSPLPGVSAGANGNANGRSGAVDATGHLPNTPNVHNSAEAASESGSQSQRAANKNAPRLPDEKTLAMLTEEERGALIRKFDRDVKAAQAVARAFRARGWKMAKPTSLGRVAVYAEKQLEARYENKAARSLPRPEGASISHPVLGEHIRASAMQARGKLTQEFAPKIREAFKAQLKTLMPTLSKAMKIADKDERAKVLRQNFPRSLPNGPSAVVEELHAEAANAGWRTAKRTLGFSPKTSADFEAKAIKKGKTPLMNPVLEQRYPYLPGRRMDDVDDTTIDTINDLISEGLRRGYSPMQMLAGVPEENFDGINDFIEDDYRGELIARTEAMFAYDWGTTNAFVDSGMQQVEALDNGTDPACVARNGEVYDLDPIQGRAVDGSGDPVVDHPNGTLVWLPTGNLDNLIDTGALDTLGLAHWDEKFAQRAMTKGMTPPPETEVDSETVLIARNRMTIGRGPHKFQAARFTHPNGHPRCYLCGQEETLTGQCVGSDYDGGKWIHMPDTTTVDTVDEKGDVVGHDFHGNQFVHPGGAGMTGVHFHARLGHMISSGAADEAAKQLKAGGFTYSLDKGFHNIGDNGFGVSTEKGREAEFTHEPTKNDIVRYAMAHSDILSQPGMHMGGWKDGDRYVLDVSRVVDSHDEAVKLGNEHNQDAIFNYKTGESEYLREPAPKVPVPAGKAADGDVEETKPAKVKGKRGETSGHPFHGNRWTGSLGSAANTEVLRGGQIPAPKGTSKVATAAAELKGLTPDTAKANLLALYDKNPNAATEGAWYAMQHDVIGQRAAAMNVDPQLYAAVVAATSPQMAWDVTRKDGVTTYPNLAAADKVIQISRDFPGRDPAELAQSLEHPGMLKTSLENGLRLMAGEPADKVLGGPKIRSFYNNLTFPDQTDDTTVDTHMARALANKVDLSDAAAGLLTDAPKLTKSGAYGKGANGYGWSADVIRAAAAERNVSAARMQAATWVQWRRDNPYQGRREHV